MGDPATSAVISAGANVAQGVIGMIGQRAREERSLKNTKDLMGIQHQNQMSLNKQGKDLAYQQWLDTNYGAQREQMEKAGLNVGLMYGMGGGAGGTTSAGSGGSAAMGSAPQPQQMPTMDIGSAMLMKSQIDLMQAQAKKTNVEADKLAGADTANVQANTALTNMNTANATIENEIKSKTLEDIVTTIGANRNKAIGEAKSAMTSGNVDETTYKTQIEQINNDSMLTAIKIGAEKQGIMLSQAQIQNMTEQIKIGRVNAEKISMDQVQGKALNQLIETIYNKLGVSNETIK